MRRRICRKWSLVIIAGLLLMSFLVIIYSLIILINYKQSNPQVTICDDSKHIDNNNGLLFYWSFENINDEIVEDNSGNDIVGRVESNITLDFPHRLVKNKFDLNYLLGTPEIVEGVKGNAIELNGRQCISAGNINEYNTNTFTVSIWVYRESLGWEVPTIMSKSSWPWFDGWWLCVKSYENDVDMAIAWGTSFKHIESGYKLPLKEWHHIAVTMNNIDHEVQFYVDGMPFGEKHNNVHEWIVNRNHDLYIGDYDGSIRWPWDGKLDEVRYYKRILSSEEIYEIFREENQLFFSNNSEI